MTRNVWGLVALGCGLVAPPAAGQTVETPTTKTPGVIALTGGQGYGYSAGLNTYSFALTNAAGSAGAASGYTTTEYGSATSAAQGTYGLQIESTASNKAQVYYGTAGVGSNALGAPANFNHSQGYAWNVYRPRGNDPSQQYIQFAVGSGDYAYPGLALTLNGNVSPTATLVQANAYLNSVLEFKADGFIDPATGNPIVTAGVNAVGVFSFSFDPTSFDAFNGYTRIDLNYSPVPEPALSVAAAAAMTFAWRYRRRRAAGG